MVTGELVIEKHANGTKEWSVKMIWGRRGSRPIFYSEVLYTIFPTRWHYDALNTKVVLLFYQYYIDQNHLEMSRNLRNHHQDCRQGFWNNKSRLLLQNKTCLRTFWSATREEAITKFQIWFITVNCQLYILYFLFFNDDLNAILKPPLCCLVCHYARKYYIPNGFCPQALKF